MTTNLEKMTKWEVQKATFLILMAKDLEMDIHCYGELDVNQNSGYTYLWLEDYDFTLYLPINCDLKREDVYVLWTNHHTGEEIEESLEEFNDLQDINEWVKKLENEHGLS
jgi:hypothetical protein